MIRSIKTFVAVLSVLMASAAFGQTSQSVIATSNNGSFSVTGAASTTGLLTDAANFGLWVDTQSDILLFDVRMNVSKGTWFNETATGLGDDKNPPNPALLVAFPALADDSWITTPNAGSSFAGAVTFSDSGDTATVFDTVDDGPQTGFQFGQVTLLADANGEAMATVTGQMQTAASPTPIFDDFEFTLQIGPTAVPGCIDPAATNYDPSATVDDGSCAYPVRFEDGVAGANGSQVSGFFTANGSDASLVAANDNGAYPDGVTLFVPTDAAVSLSGIALDVQDLLVAGSTDADPGYSAAEITALVGGVGSGGSVDVAALSGDVFRVQEGSLFYGGAEVIVADAQKTDNGWIHIIDAVPNAVPEPGSLPLLMVAGLFGLVGVRRRRR